MIDAAPIAIAGLKLSRLVSRMCLAGFGRERGLLRLGRRSAERAIGRCNHRPFPTLALAVVVLCTVGRHIAPAAETAERTVVAMLAEIDALSAEPVPESEMARRFTEIEGRYFDRTAMARAGLGTYGAKLGGSELAGYVSAYRIYLARTFVFGVRKTGSSDSRVLGSRVGSDGSTIVISRVRAAKKERDVLWFICADGQTICDVEVDGARASARQREIFLKILHERGLAALVRDLKSGALVGVT